MANFPTVASYDRGTNNTVLFLGRLTLWFSYKTIIAFQLHEGIGKKDLIVRTNDWGPTTGRHLNAIDGGSKEAQEKRLPNDAFEDSLLFALRRVGLTQ